jgi:hypothetical protein
MTGRRGLVWGLAVLALVGAFLLLRPGAPGPPLARSREPGGTLALRRFLAARGLTVSDATAPQAGGGTFVLLADLRTFEQDSEILRWVDGGGRLVLADPQSELARQLLVDSPGSVGAIRTTTTLIADCAGPEAVAAGSIEVRSSDRGLRSVMANAHQCFGGSVGSFLVSRSVGAGTAVVLGGFSPFTNALLDHAGNASFAEQVLGSSQPVVFGTAVVPGTGTAAESEKGVWGSLPAGAKAALLAVAIAALFFVLVRGRRLGTPVLEEPISPIPAGELVRATAKLYRKAGARGFAGELLRTGTATQTARRLGIPASTSPEALSSAMADTAGLPAERVQRALEGPPPGTDDQLLALGRELEAIRAAVEAGAGIGHTEGP